MEGGEQSLKGALIRFTSMSSAFGCGSRERLPRGSVPSPCGGFRIISRPSEPWGWLPRVGRKVLRFAGPDGPEGPVGNDAPEGSSTDVGRNQIVDSCSSGQRLHLNKCTLHSAPRLMCNAQLFSLGGSSYRRATLSQAPPALRARRRSEGTRSRGGRGGDARRRSRPRGESAPGAWSRCSGRGSARCCG